MTPRKWRIQFQAPPQVNSYLFQLHVKSDSYYGTDLAKVVVLKVQDASELEENVEIEEIPDELEKGMFYALESWLLDAEDSDEESGGSDDDSDSDTSTDSDSDSNSD